MMLLAVDTSSNACSVALQTPHGITERHVVEPRAHTKILIPMITELLSEGAVALSDLDAIVLGNGPGSFIGMRIGASVVQGLCFGAALPVVPVSSLAAIAAEAFAEHDCNRLVVAQDARMNEVYMGRFERGDAALPVPLEAERIVAVGELSTGGEDMAAAGAAWDRYPELRSANSRNIGSFLEICVPRARYLLALGAASFDAGRTVAAEEVSPAYLRQKIAEVPSNMSK
jgi:tRNA threonylcarbamoyladenosine biosynthesis protein TsaB